MAYPHPDELVAALLELLFLEGGPQHEMKSSATYHPLAERFGLTQSERLVTRKFADGRYEPEWNNRVQWARNELRKAGMLDKEAPHGRWRLSAEGIVAGQQAVRRALARGAEQQSLFPQLFGAARDTRPDSLPDVEELNISVREGGRRLVTHFRRERSAKVVRAKKEQVLALTHELRCEACLFDFRETYGDRGLGFCEVHHTKPLSDDDRDVETSVDDLAVLCSNCHRMIHRNPFISVNQLRDFIAAHRLEREGRAA